MWGLVFLFALAGTSVLGEELVAFPEVAREKAGERIVSGWPAAAGQIPFQLNLRAVNDLGAVTACGASIIHEDWALTAAHCTALRVTIVIRVGTINVTHPERIFETKEYYNHPLYIEENVGEVQHHDIGLIKFNQRFPFSHLNQPIRMQRYADRNKNYDRAIMTASGWGRLWTNGVVPEILFWVYLTGVTNSFCHDSFEAIVIDSTICASGYNMTTQSTCQGDSGGPLTVVDEDNKLTLVGVASFVSARGCHVDLPAGFIRPGHYHDWFTEVTGINFDWDFEGEVTRGGGGGETAVDPRKI